MQNIKKQVNNLFFLEKQYLGLNRMSLFRRIVLAIFLFFASWMAYNPEKVPTNWFSSQSGDLFFIMGIFILVISTILVFILHFETRVVNNALVLDGLWTSRKIKISISTLVSADQIIYSKGFFTKSVYNLHYKGTIRFYTRGKEAVKIVDKDGQVYIIGSQKSEELCRIIKQKINE